MLHNGTRELEFRFFVFKHVYFNAFFVISTYINPCFHTSSWKPFQNPLPCHGCCILTSHINPLIIQSPWKSIGSSWKSIKSSSNPIKPPFSHRIFPWNPWNHHENPWKSIGSPWKSPFLFAPKDRETLQRKAVELQRQLDALVSGFEATVPWAQFRVRSESPFVGDETLR